METTGAQTLLNVMKPLRMVCTDDKYCRSFEQFRRRQLHMTFRTALMLAKYEKVPFVTKTQL